MTMNQYIPAKAILCDQWLGPFRCEKFLGHDGSCSFDSNSAPAQKHLSVFDAVTGVTYSRNDWNAHKAAKLIYDAAQASDLLTCPSIEIMQAIIRECYQCALK